MNHLEVLQVENFQSSAEKSWLKWIEEAESKIGYSLDGDQTTDGYSYDFAYDAWESGKTVDKYLTSLF